MDTKHILMPLILLIIVIYSIVVIFNNIIFFKRSNKNIDKNRIIITEYFKNYILNNETNTKTLFIIPHLELGDNLIINGMIHHYLEKQNVILVCKLKYLEQLEIMYANTFDKKYKLYFYPVKGGSLENINIYNEIPIDEKLTEYLNDNNIHVNIFNGYKLNYYKLPNIVLNSYPMYFYNDNRLDNTIQYTKFKISKNEKEEDEIYQRLINTIGTNYIVIIDDEKRNLLLNNKYINSNIPIFKLGLDSKNKIDALNKIRDKNIFNYIKILENANEIHSIDSCILLLIDMLPIKGKIFAHKYVRSNIFTNVNYNNKYIKYIS
jgi:hypothetical protein